MKHFLRIEIQISGLALDLKQSCINMSPNWGCDKGPSKMMAFIMFYQPFLLTWPMAKLYTSGDYIFNREIKVQTFFSGSRTAK